MEGEESVPRAITVEKMEYAERFLREFPRCTIGQLRAAIKAEFGSTLRTRPLNQIVQRVRAEMEEERRRATSLLGTNGNLGAVSIVAVQKNEDGSTDITIRIKG